MNDQMLQHLVFCPACEETNITRIDYHDGTIALCRSCNLQWVENVDTRHAQLAEDGMNASYYMNPLSHGPVTLYPPFIAFFSRVQEHFGNKALRILDVGCGTGCFIEAAINRGHDPVGVELNSAYAVRMDEKISKKIIFGVPVEEVDWANTAAFDMITFWDSFEHLPDPFFVLEKLRSLLSQNGMIYLRVNNRYDIFNITTDIFLRICPPLGRRLLRKCFNFPMHAWNFSRQAMEKMLARNGWKPILITFSDTPAGRLSKNRVVQAAFRCGYAVNHIIGGGKIGEYFIVCSIKK